jgi:hypothetical protein
MHAVLLDAQRVEVGLLLEAHLERQALERDRGAEGGHQRIAHRRQGHVHGAIAGVVGRRLLCRAAQAGVLLGDDHRAGAPDLVGVDLRDRQIEIARLRTGHVHQWVVDIGRLERRADALSAARRQHPLHLIQAEDGVEAQDGVGPVLELGGLEAFGVVQHHLADLERAFLGDAQRGQDGCSRRHSSPATSSKAASVRSIV